MTDYDSNGERKTPYVEDSTKGKSQLKPLNYKGDVLTQAWMDSRVLATLYVWLESNGYYAKSFSDVARKPLEMLVEWLVEQGKVTMIEETAQARRIIQSRFRVSLNRGGRGEKNVLHNNILSGMREELTERVKDDSKLADAQKTLSGGVNSELLAAAVEVYNKLSQQQKGESRTPDIYEEEKLKRQREMYENRQKALQDAKNSNLLIDDASVKALAGQEKWTEDMAPRKLTDEEIAAKEREIAERDKKLIEESHLPPDLEFMKKNVVDE